MQKRQNRNLILLVHIRKKGLENIIEHLFNTRKRDNFKRKDFNVDQIIKGKDRMHL